ncbi:unnamed protein product [Amoebophrya sp. A120]|nr:unnamed protein product [Amoebophrya sp. A120]|eukprot:GSA120T00005356001.1
MSDASTSATPLPMVAFSDDRTTCRTCCDASTPSDEQATCVTCDELQAERITRWIEGDIKRIVKQPQLRVMVEVEIVSRLQILGEQLARDLYWSAASRKALINMAVRKILAASGVGLIGEKTRAFCRDHLGLNKPTQKQERGNSSCLKSKTSAAVGASHHTVVRKNNEKQRRANKPMQLCSGFFFEEDKFRAPPVPSSCSWSSTSSSSSTSTSARTSRNYSDVIPIPETETSFHHDKVEDVW